MRDQQTFPVTEASEDTVFAVVLGDSVRGWSTGLICKRGEERTGDDRGSSEIQKTFKTGNFNWTVKDPL